MEFYIPIENIPLEGTMSHIFDIGPRFDFMKSRKIIMKKIIEIFPFFDIKIKLRPILRF